FLRAEKGFLLDGVNGKIQAEQRESARDPGASAVRFTVATEGEPRKPLREGLVLSLIFRIRPEATANTKVALRFQELSAATVDEPPRPVEPLTGTPGSVEVLSPESVPYVACFFFSH
ncbi:MAG TPA: hypothetical protein VNN17_01195, partial [Terriglobia bacterium]|nr:hypothetical protein [Terriglobia bacterium]